MSTGKLTNPALKLLCCVPLKHYVCKEGNDTIATTAAVTKQTAVSDHREAGVDRRRFHSTQAASRDSLNVLLISRI